MKIQRKLSLALATLAMALLTSSAHASGKNPALEADRAAINQACASEASTAGCAGKTVGKGLLKCLGAYKKAQKAAGKPFQYGDACKAAIQKGRADRQAAKTQTGK